MQWVPDRPGGGFLWETCFSRAVRTAVHHQSRIQSSHPATLAGPARGEDTPFNYLVSTSTRDTSVTCLNLAPLPAQWGSLGALLFARLGSWVSREAVSSGLVSQAASSPSSAPSLSSLASLECQDGYQRPGTLLTRWQVFDRGL